MKIKTRQERIFEKLGQDLREAGVVRYQKKLSKVNSLKDLGIPKMTNLMTRCPSYQKLLQELKSMPEKQP